MNVVREINKINERELELGVKGSWHDEYKDSAYVFVGGLAYDLSEGDVVTIMSQYGEVMDINMPRDPETGKPKGFCFLMYEDQRSTVLAVDNLTGAQVLGRTIRVDHCKKYEQRGSKNENGDYVAPEEPTYNVMPPTLDGSSDEESSDSEPDELDDEDPMATYLRQQKKAKRITDGKKRKHEGGESKEEKKARKEEKRRRKDERDRKRRERESKKGASSSKGRSRSPKRERGESRVSGRREEVEREDRVASGSRDGRREGGRSRHDDDEREDRQRSRPRDEDRDRHLSRPRDENRDDRHRSRPLDEDRDNRHRSRPRDEDRDDRHRSRPRDEDREDRHHSRPHDERSERHRSIHRDDREERQSSRPRLDREEERRRPHHDSDSPPRSNSGQPAWNGDSQSRPRERERDDRDRRPVRDSRDEGNGARNGYGDREPRARAEDIFVKEEMARGPMMNPDRARLLAGGGAGGGRGGYSNGGPPRDDRFSRR